MDILKDISQKLNTLSDDAIPSGLRAVLAHIEIAERHFNRAKLERDSNLFTDVIYRTNHAFEGILKEAYVVLEQKSADKIRPFDIEEYLTKNVVFKERVMELFTNYRTNWRNPSTHDYRLSFSEQEAFLAIVTVSAFTSILLDQMVELISFRLEKSQLENNATKIKESIKDYDNLSPIDKIAHILLNFEQGLINGGESLLKVSAAQLSGMISGYLTSIESNAHINFEPKLGIKGKIFRADLVIELDNQKIVLEIKQVKVSPYYEDIEHQTVVSRIAEFLKEGGVRNAIIFYPPQDKNQTAVLTFTTDRHKKSGLNIRTIYGADKHHFQEPPGKEEYHSDDDQESES